jgi:5-methyltetrahydropteroyltriglutamate--homocysteine methyltransferase
VTAVESEDELRRRIDEAAKVVDLERLAISPQCGFASGFRGHPCTIAQQNAKLRLIVELARKIWGSA